MFSVETPNINLTTTNHVTTINTHTSMDWNEAKLKSIRQTWALFIATSWDSLGCPTKRVSLPSSFTNLWLSSAGVHLPGTRTQSSMGSPSMIPELTVSPNTDRVIALLGSEPVRAASLLSTCHVGSDDLLVCSALWHLCAWAAVTAQNASLQSLHFFVPPACASLYNTSLFLMSTPLALIRAKRRVCLSQRWPG